MYYYVIGTSKNLREEVDQLKKDLEKSERLRKQWLHESKMLGNILRNLNIEIPKHKPKFKNEESKQNYLSILRGVFNDDNIDLHIDDENQEWIDLPEKDPL